jgi:hypothetical protein
LDFKDFWQLLNTRLGSEILSGKASSAQELLAFGSPPFPLETGNRVKDLKLSLCKSSFWSYNVAEI